MKILIAGAGGFARECLQIARDCGHVVAACVVPDGSASPMTLLGTPIIFESDAPSGIPIMLGMGHSWTRRKASLQYPGAIGLIHPSVIRGAFADIGEGTIMCIGCIATENLIVGRFALINMGVVISHDAKIGDYCILSPRATICGGVEIGEGTEIGTGAVILPDVKVGKWATIGAGAVVTQDVPDNATAVGVPARVIKQKTEGRQPCWPTEVVQSAVDTLAREAGKLSATGRFTLAQAQAQVLAQDPDLAARWLAEVNRTLPK